MPPRTSYLHGRKRLSPIFIKSLLQEYLGTGVLNIPEAEPEALLPCVPCPVYDYPDDCVEGMWHRLIKEKKKYIMSLKHQEILREKAVKAKAEAEKTKQRPPPPPPVSWIFRLWSLYIVEIVGIRYL